MVFMGLIIDNFLSYPNGYEEALSILILSKNNSFAFGFSKCKVMLR